ncbi:MAG: hypothetical protein U5J63_12360 [Fodinibius sp.]|nr:hypothetical protein [Fodinibius sp.]
MSYQFFYWLHVFSYIIWLIAFGISLFLGYRITAEADAVQKRTYMRLERLSTLVGAHIGVLGILISGWAMSSISAGPQWGWFSLQLYPWLALKQLLFIAILVLVGFSIKKSLAFKKRLDQEEGNAMGKQTSEKWWKAYRISLAVYILVVISTVLGWTRPLLSL